MSCQIIKQLNKLSEYKFSFLKLKSIDVNAKKQLFIVQYIFPESQKDVIFDFYDEILALTKKILDVKAEVDIKLTLSHFDRSFFLRELNAFLFEIPALSAFLRPQDIVITEKENVKNVEIKLLKTVYDYAAGRDILKEITQFFEPLYCDEICFNFTQREEDDDNFDGDDDNDIFDDDGGTDFTGERCIIPQCVEEYIGKIIYSKAMYIEDAVRPQTNLVVCGRVIKMFCHEYEREKDGEAVKKSLYRMTISDTTGTIDAVYFPTKLSKDKIKLIKEGSEIVVRGTLEPDKRDESKLSYRIKDISLCFFPKDFEPIVLKRRYLNDYIAVTPQKYIKREQASLFDVCSEKTATKSLLNRTFCVFDVETTGLNPLSDKIIEIGAVKIVNGVFTETFSTLIDPKIAIPQRITALTGITDADVSNCPEIDDVMVDFYKFIKDTELVAQNISFDISFVKNKGKPLNIYFDNPQHDTLVLSRKYFPRLKNYKLETLAEYCGVSLENAHRALDDAVATAEVFIKIMETADKKEHAG